MKSRFGLFGAQNSGAWGAAILLTALSLGAASGCSGGHDSSDRVLTAVQVSAVEKATASAGARYSAAIRPQSQVDLAFKLGGYVREIAKVKGVDGKPRLIQDGDWVSKSTQLAALRESDYTQKLAEAKAMLAEAAAAKSQASTDLDRDEKLSASSAVSRAYIDTSKTRAATANAKVEAASARVQQAEQAVADTSLRAPMDGILLKRNVEVGALAAPGMPVFTLADTSRVKVVFGVPDTVLETLKIGNEQSITLEAYPNQVFKGQITKIAPWADPKSRVFEVEVTVPNDAGLLRVGMVASLQLAESGPSQPAALLPLNAIVRNPKDQNGFAVFVLDEASHLVHLRAVELGDFLGNRVPVRSGLKEGEKVVVLGASLLSDGETVRVIP